MMKWLKNPYLTAACALFLGGYLIWLSSHKIDDPPDFAKSVCNFKILPANLVNLAAIYLPWLELFSGIALVTWFCRRGGAVVTGSLLVLFIVALTYNLWRGHPTICGCDVKYEEAKMWTDEVKFQKMRERIAQDCGLLALSLQVLYGSRRKKPKVEPPE